ncbi:MAG: hypothetical protein H0W30_02290 [Gemmatimonadaceae bacterium]|nr:hypothetical protein [Gemmatimonadaceae bacterium]MDQ3520651.1 hypothetical protein [Gemmatimonadota bacterium]
MTRSNHEVARFLHIILASLCISACRPGEQHAVDSSGAKADVQELSIGALEDEFGLQLNRPRLGRPD